MKDFLSILLFITQLLPRAPKPAASVTPMERVEIVVFSDFQCPFCAQFAQPIRELQSKGIEGIQTSVEFKHFPLSIHPAALDRRFLGLSMSVLCAIRATHQGTSIQGYRGHSNIR